MAAVWVWPPRSPDLNPIETMWSIVAREVDLRGPIERSELVKFVREEWDKIPQSTVDALVLSFGKRMRECAKKDGGETGY